MPYDPYSDIPPDLRPTTSDAVALSEIARLFKDAVKIRHDFHTAIHVEDTFASIRHAFVPAILTQQQPAERHLKSPGSWESFFAQSARPDAKTKAGLAAEHQRIAREASTNVDKIRGNVKLGRFVKDNLNALFPDIGYSAATGDALRRLRKDDRSVLQIFHPLGVEDVSNIIRLLLKRKPGTYYYW